MVYRVMENNIEIHTIYANSPLSKEDIIFLTKEAGNEREQSDWIIMEDN